jgi:hypothetical protein
MDDTLQPTYGANMIMMFGDITELIPNSSLYLADEYFPTLDQAELFTPVARISTLAPFSVLVEQDIDATSPAVVLNGFHEAEPAHPGSYDEDIDVDMEDFAGLQECFCGEGGRVTGDCHMFDFDGDLDVDLEDFIVFAVNMTGPEPMP